MHSELELMKQQRDQREWEADQVSCHPLTLPTGTPTSITVAYDPTEPAAILAPCSAGQRRQAGVCRTAAKPVRLAALPDTHTLAPPPPTRLQPALTPVRVVVVIVVGVVDHSTEVEAQRRKSVAAAARSSVRSKERARAREKDRVKQSLVNRARRATLGALNKVKATAAAAAVTPSNADDGGRAGDTAGAPAPSAPSPAATATSDNGELQAGDDAQVQARAAKRRASQDAAASAAAGAGDAATAGDSGGGASDDSVGSGGGGVLAELEAAGDDVTGGATAAGGGAGVSGADGVAATMDDADQEIAELESYLDSLADSGDDNA